MANSSMNQAGLLPLPTNFVHLYRGIVASQYLAPMRPSKYDIREHFVIDSSMAPATGMFRPSSSPTNNQILWKSDEDQGINGDWRVRGESWKNLKLGTRGGEIDVDIHLVPSEKPSTIELVVDKVESDKVERPLITRIHAPMPRSSLHLTARTSSQVETRHPNRNPVHLHLPNTFHGPILIHVASGQLADRIKLSKEVDDNSVVMREDEFTRGIFVSSPSIHGIPRNASDYLPKDDNSQKQQQRQPTMTNGTTSTTPESSSTYRKHPPNFQPGIPTTRSFKRKGRVDIEETQWIGDKVEIWVDTGKVWIQFEDENIDHSKHYWFPVFRTIFVKIFKVLRVLAIPLAVYLARPYYSAYFLNVPGYPQVVQATNNLLQKFNFPMLSLLDQPSSTSDSQVVQQFHLWFRPFLLCLR